MGTHRRLSPWLLPLLLIPTAAFANGVSPVLNFFHRETWAPASVVTLVIILVESVLLRWRVEGLRFAGALWRSAVLNLASSVTGSILLMLFSRDSFFMLRTMSLVAPLFLITLVTEVPLLHRLFQATRLTWPRAALLGCGINMVSYTAVLVVEVGLLFGWLGYAGRLDAKDLERWNNPDLVRQASGLIYATESSGSVHRLRVCVLPSTEWTTLAACPPLDPNTWDVEGSSLAFVPWNAGSGKSRELVVCRLPDFATLMEVSASSLPEVAAEGWEGVTGVAVSRDEGKIAILIRQASVVAPRDRSSHFDLGGRCRLVVLDIASGQAAGRSTRWASDRGLCWLSDSRRVVFSSFDDEALYETPRAEVHGDTSYHIGYAQDDRFRRGLYMLDLETGLTTRFADGVDPSLAVGTGAILARDQGGLVLVGASGDTQVRIDAPRMSLVGAVVSPSGDMVLTEIPRRVPFHPGGRLVLFHTQAPEVRHMLCEGLSYRVDWTLGDDLRQ